jgi:hypothetical protein
MPEEGLILLVIRYLRENVGRLGRMPFQRNSFLYALPDRKGVPGGMDYCTDSFWITYPHPDS